MKCSYSLWSVFHILERDNPVFLNCICVCSRLGSCTNRDLSISQSKGSSSGIPQYIVEIVNTCVHGCATSNIHLHCGWFASTKMVNPKTFKRLSYDDCLVNGGRPLKTSQIIRFTYSNSFMYPITFKFADFCWCNTQTMPCIFKKNSLWNLKDTRWNPKIILLGNADYNA